MIQVNKRSIGVCILLSIITFGIYGIYWLYLLVKNTYSIQKNTTSCTGEMLCLIFLPFYSLYWWYTRGEKVKQEFSQHNYASTGNGIVYLILAIFGLSIVSMAIMQSDFNSLKSETHSEQRSDNRSLLVLVQCSLLLAIGLVFRYFSQMIPIAGVGGMRLSISVFFTRIPAILFGPFYGAAVGGLADFLGWLIRPDEGAYIFPMTVTAAIGGLLAGIIFKYIKNIKLNKHHRGIYLIVSVLFGVFGLMNHMCSTVFSDSNFGRLILQLGEKRLPYFTYGFYVCFIVGILFYLINLFIEKFSNKPFAELYMKIFVTLLCANIPVTTLNTFVLRWFYDGLAKLPFSVVYAPRVIEEIITTFITAYVVTYLYKVFERLNRNISDNKQ